MKKIKYNHHMVTGLNALWQERNQLSNDRFLECQRFTNGEGQRDWLRKAFPTSQDTILNYISKLSQREKSDICDFSVSLSVSSKKSGINVMSLKKVESILQDIFNRSDHLSCFTKALNNIYDYGYAVLFIMSEEDPWGLPHLRINNLSKPYSAFFDTNVDDPSFGEFCGMIYEEFSVEKNSSVEVIDFFYRKREPQLVYEDTNRFTYTRRPDGLTTGSYFEKEKNVENLYHMRFRDGKKVENSPIGPCKKLPMVYLPGVSDFNEFNNQKRNKSSTIPFAYTLIGAQNVLNFAMSSVLSQSLRSSRLEILSMPKSAIDNSIRGVNDALLEGGVLTFSQVTSQGVDADRALTPQFIPPTPIDASLINLIEMASKSLLFLADFSVTEGQVMSTPDSPEASQAKKMGASFFKKRALNSLEHGVQSIGDILMYLIPAIYLEERHYIFGGEALDLNVPGEETSEELFLRHNLDITLVHGEAEIEARNLDVLNKLASTLSANNPESRDLLTYIMSTNLKGTSADYIKRFVEANMDPTTLEFVQGRLSRRDYQQLREANAKKMAPPIDFAKEELELDKKRFELAIQEAKSNSELKARDIAIKEAKAKEELLTKQQELRIKAQPKTENIVVDKNPKSD